MKVTYNGFTGELEKLERRQTGRSGYYFWDLTLYDEEKKATISFTSVILEEVKFYAKEVSF